MKKKKSFLTNLNCVLWFSCHTNSDSSRFGFKLGQCEVGLCRRAAPIILGLARAVLPDALQSHRLHVGAAVHDRLRQHADGLAVRLLVLVDGRRAVVVHSLDVVRPLGHLGLSDGLTLIFVPDAAQILVAHARADARQNLLGRGLVDDVVACVAGGLHDADALRVAGGLAGVHEAVPDVGLVAHLLDLGLDAWVAPVGDAGGDLLARLADAAGSLELDVFLSVEVGHFFFFVLDIYFFFCLLRRKKRNFLLKSFFFFFKSKSFRIIFFFRINLK
jgi:hypothetical protein